MDIELNANVIYEKSFKNAITNGYNKKDVDEFLDVIIQDYEKFENYVKQLEEQKQELQEEIDRLKRNQNNDSQQTTQLHANYDILKRISNLEKAVFGQKSSE